MKKNRKKISFSLSITYKSKIDLYVQIHYILINFNRHSTNLDNVRPSFSRSRRRELHVLFSSSRRSGINEGFSGSHPRDHERGIATPRRVSAISLKVARGPLRAVSRLGARLNVFLFSLIFVEHNRGRCARRRNPSSALVLFLRISRFPAFSASQFTTRETFLSRRAPSPSSPRRNRMRYFASRNYRCVFVRPPFPSKKREPKGNFSRESGERSNEMMRTTASTDRNLK